MKNAKIILTILVISLCLCLGACHLISPDKNKTPDPTPDATVPDVSGIALESKEYVYDGTEKKLSVKGTLPDGVSVKYTGNSAINVGEYTVGAKLIYNGGELLKELSATITIKKATYNMRLVTFPDATEVYTGTVKEPYVVGKLPIGVTVTFTSDKEIKDTGTYKVTAVFTGNPNYEDIPSLEAVYTVTKATYNMLGVSLPNATVSYTGSEITPTLIGNLPAGVSVSFHSSPEKIIDVGEYIVTATFKGDYANYNEIPDMTAKYVVEQGNQELSGVSLPSVVVSYTGEVITPKIIGNLPEGVSCEITSVPAVIKDVGTYTVTAKFTSTNPLYGNIPDMTTKYVITPAKYVEGTLIFSPMSDGTYEVTGCSPDAKIIVIPDTYDGKAVTSVRSSAFIGNELLTYVHIPSSVTNIGNKTFKNCKNLTHLIIENGIEVIGAEAFAGTSIKSIVLPDSLVSIGQGALLGTPLESITLPFVGGSRLTSNPFIGYLFGALTYSGNAAKVPASLSVVTFSDAVTEIPAYSFYGCVGIKEIKIGRGVSRIGNSAFSGCTSLHDVYIPDTVTDIPANFQAYNSPFWGCADDLMIVMGSVSSSTFGKYWSSVTDTQDALIVYSKTYEDYIANKNTYRDFDPTVAELHSISLGNKLLNGFSTDKLSYSVSVDINDGYPVISVASVSPISAVTIVNPSASNGGIATVTVTSADGSATKTYKITITVTGSFNGASAEVVGKNGTSGTVTFVVDDGDHATAEFTTEMMDKYPTLKFTYAILTNRLAKLNTSYDSASGKYNYVMNNGKYTYTQNQIEVNFWKNILANYDTEVISHTHTHAFWGIDDEGGVQKYVDSSGNVKTSDNLPVGSSTAEIYAAKQLIEELLGIRAITHTIPGIGVKTTDTTVGGISYKTYNTYYMALINKALAEGDIVNLIGNVMGVSQSAISKYVTKDNIKASGGVARLMVGANDDKTLWTKFIDSAAANNGWATYCIHKISPSATSGHYILESDAEALFKYAYEKNVWVANYTEAALYYSEWASAKTSVTSTDGKILVTLTDEEDNRVYDEALTVKVTVPSTWAHASVGSEELTVHTDEDGKAFVYVNIVPDSGTVEITCASK